MAEKSLFFNSINGDRKYQAADFALFFGSLVGNGVFPDPTTNLQVESNSNMTVIVRPGKAWIDGYLYYKPENLTLTLSPADSVYNRIDRIVVGWNANTRVITTYVLPGTPSAVPVAPSLTRSVDVYELALADIFVTKNVTYIYQANITDRRTNKNLCGIVTGLIDQIDATDLFAQFTSVFNDWFGAVQTTLSGDVAGNLLTLINANTKGTKDLGTVVTANKTAYDLEKAAMKEPFGVKMAGDAVQQGEYILNLKDAISGMKKETNFAKLETTKNVTILKKGIYILSGQCHQSAGFSSGEFSFGVFVGNTGLPSVMSKGFEGYFPVKKSASGSVFCAMNASGVIQLNVGDTVYLQANPPSPVGNYRLDGNICKLTIAPIAFL